MTYQQRFERYVGFISPPCGYSEQQFSELCHGSVGVVQHMAHYPGASYGPAVEDRERRLAHFG